MKSWKVLAGLIAALAVPVLAQAQAEPSEPTYSKEYDACVDGAGAVIPALRECDGSEAGRQDKELNAVYAQLIARIDAKAQNRVRAAERAWLAYRDAECDAQMLPFDGGQEWYSMSSGCHHTLTDRRIQELKALYSNVSQFMQPGEVFESNDPGP